MIANISPLSADLAAYAEEHGPVTVGLAGAGQMGTDLIVQIALMPGLRLGAIAEVDAGRVRQAFMVAGRDLDDIAVAGKPADVDRAIETGKVAVTPDLATLAAAGHIDVVIDATGNPNIGTTLALEAIRNGKHIVMLNVEADITIGRFLKQQADQAGVIYSGAAGDEPAATLELVAFAQSLGMTVVCAGKGKNNAFNIHAVPADYEAEARARNMNPRMLVEFIDGSKTMVEMVALANCTGLVPDIPGMHGPAASRDELADVLIPREHGGLLSRRGCVDYSTGEGVAPGVFCIVEGNHPRVTERIADLRVGKGPFFALLRPFHLTSLEVPLTAARAVIYKRADMVPLDYPVAEATALAKRDLKPGETMGRIGGSDYRAFAMTWSDARHAKALPLGLVEGAKVLKPVKAGEQLTYGNCLADASLAVTQIRQRLDAADERFLTAAE